MKKYTMIFLISIIVLAIGAYFAFQPRTLDTTTEIVHSIHGTAWQLLSYNGTPLTGDEEYTLLFAEGKMYGHFCNSIKGRYKLSFNTVKVSTATGTEMTCTDHGDSIMEIEKAVVTGLQNGAEFDLFGETMNLTLDNDIPSTWKLLSHEERPTETATSIPTTTTTIR